MPDLLDNLVYPVIVGLLLMFVGYLCNIARRWRARKQAEREEAEAAGKALKVAAVLSGIAVIWMLTKKTA